MQHQVVAGKVGPLTIIDGEWHIVIDSDIRRVLGLVKDHESIGYQMMRLRRPCEKSAQRREDIFILDGVPGRGIVENHISRLGVPEHL